MNARSPGTQRHVLISVIGTGYLGATHAACLAACGHQVVGIDNDAVKVARLSSGTAPFHEPGLGELLRQGVDSGVLTFDTDIHRVVDADVQFLCVGTPQRAGIHAADVSPLEAAADAMAPVLTRPCLVVPKSTFPLGTAPTLRE